VKIALKAVHCVGVVIVDLGRTHARCPDNRSNHIAGHANCTDALVKLLNVAIAQKTLFKTDLVGRSQGIDATEYSLCHAISL